MYKYGVISGPHFPVFGLNTERYSPNTGKYGPEITPFLDTFHAVIGLVEAALWPKIRGSKQGILTLILIAMTNFLICQRSIFSL